jgi:hypothetical protein
MTEVASNSNTKGKEDKEDSDIDTVDETALERGRQLLDESDSLARTGTTPQQQLREPGTPPANMPPDATRNKIKLLSRMKKLSKSCASVVDIPSGTGLNLIHTKSTSPDPISNSGDPATKEISCLRIRYIKVLGITKKLIQMNIMRSAK